MRLSLIYIFISMYFFSCGTDTSTSVLGEDEATNVKTEKLSAETKLDSQKESVLITGFGPFKDIKENPTGTLVQDSDFQKNLIDKYPQYNFTFDTLDVKKGEFDRRYANQKFDRVINLGVDSSASSIRVEPGATNWTGAHGDECPAGVCVQGAENGRNQVFKSAIFPQPTFFQNNMAGSYPIEAGTYRSVGDYVCATTYCEALNRNSNAVFVHTPLPTDAAQYRSNMTIFFDKFLQQK